MIKSPTLCILADVGSPHTVKWVHALSARGFRVHNISFRHGTIPGIPVYSLIGKDVATRHELCKLIYLSSVRRLRTILGELKPDIIHAHYASSYGLLAVLGGFRPLIVSLWGSDILDFPTKSCIHKGILRFVMKRAELISATSLMMKDEALKYTSKQVSVIPFGVDIDKFRSVIPEWRPENIFTIGTVKSLEKQYGVDILIRAFAIINRRHPSGNLRLLVVGDGSERKMLEQMVDRMNLNDKVEFAGGVEHRLVPDYLSRMDVFAALSRRESFGVAVLEASACGIPVVVSNIGGLPEVVQDGRTGIIVPLDHHAAADAIEKIILNPKLGRAMGLQGRRFVSQIYDWNVSVNSMIGLYDKVLKRTERRACH